MVFLGQLAVRTLDIRIAGVFGNPEHFVIISFLFSHISFTLHTSFQMGGKFPVPLAERYSLSLLVVLILILVDDLIIRVVILAAVLGCAVAGSTCARLRCTVRVDVFIHLLGHRIECLLQRLGIGFDGSDIVALTVSFSLLSAVSILFYRQR